MISTKNITETTETESKSFTKSVIPPGNYKLKINRVFLKHESKTEYGSRLILAVETPEVTDPNFKGLPIDSTNPSLGVHKGQIGNVGFSKWSFRDFLTTLGVQILKEEEILKAIKTICENLNISTWFEEADGRFPTIEAFVEGFSTEAPFKDIWAYYCVGGREYLSKDGKHTNHELFLPAYDRVLGKAFSLDEKKVQKFFYSQHVETLKPKVDAPPIKSISETLKPASFVEGNYTTSTETNADFLASINAPVEQIYHKDTPVDQPVYPKVTSQAEANFMNDKPQMKVDKVIETPFTESIMSDGPEPSTIGIVTNDSNEKLPWE